MARLVFRILGCGSSGGVPRLGGLWGNCDPADRRNQRTRCSLLVRRIEGDKSTRVLIDSSPDLRQQLLNAEVGLLDAVVYTHAHADHVNGLDDLRMIFHNRGARLPVWADDATRDELIKRFGYAFERPVGSLYPPMLEMNILTGPVTVTGDGGDITLDPFVVEHGTISSNGFIIGPLAYLPDVSAITEEVWKKLSGINCWIVDALRREPHRTHTHLEQTLEWIERVAPQRAILTNMHNDLDYQTVLNETPPHVEPAYDGFEISYDLTA